MRVRREKWDQKIKIILDSGITYILHRLVINRASEVSTDYVLIKYGVSTYALSVHYVLIK